MAAIKEALHQGSGVFQEDSPEPFGSKKLKKTSAYQAILTDATKTQTSLKKKTDKNFHLRTKFFPYARFLHFNNNLAYISL